MSQQPFTCLYYGPPDICSECGGEDETGTGLCSDDCRESRLDREERQDAEAAARRAMDAGYAAAADHLRAAGYTDDARISRLLDAMP